MTSMPQGPAGLQPPRVPRTRVDDFFIRGESLAPTRIGTAVVVSVDGETVTVLMFDEEIVGVVWLGFRPPRPGDLVEIEQRGDLLVIPAEPGDTDTFLEGVEDDSVHLVDDSDPGTPPAQLVNIGGSMRDTDAWEFPLSNVGWTRELEEDGVGIWAHAGAGAAGTAVLWSNQSFEVTHGDTLTLTASITRNSLATPIGGDASVSLVVVWGTDENLDPVLGVDEVIGYGSPLVIDGADLVFTQVVTVPNQLASGLAPRIGRIGFQITGPVSTSITFNSASMTHTLAAWPLGSLWLNPNGNQALPTTATTPAPSESPFSLPYGGATLARMPNANKAIVTAPMTTGGIVMVFVNAVFAPIATTTASIGLYFGVGTDAAVSGMLPTRLSTTTFSINNQLSASAHGWAQVDAGQTIELFPVYRYASDPGTTGVWSVRNANLTVMFLPNGVPAGAPRRPAPVSFWDGDSWRPGDLRPALTNMTTPASSAEPARLASTTTLTVSSTRTHLGSAVTLTATVSPLAADGNVTFYTAPAAAGPWTSIGAIDIDANNKAVKSFTGTTRGTAYFRAVFNAPTTYASSTSATVSTQYLAQFTDTDLITGTWGKAYNLTTDQQISGSGNDEGAWQGWDPDAGGGGAYRATLIRYPWSVPAGRYDVEITSVVLVASDWLTWADGAYGTAVIGWHENKGGSAPSTYPNTQVHGQQSRHVVGEKAWRANVTSWADTVIRRSDFGGLMLGGNGPSKAREYLGHSGGDANLRLKLEVKYVYWA